MYISILLCIFIEFKAFQKSPAKNSEFFNISQFIITESGSTQLWIIKAQKTTKKREKYLNYVSNLIREAKG